MSRNAAKRFGKRAAARLRAIRRRAAEWKRRVRRAATLALIAAGTAAVPTLAQAQMGQMAMAPAGGILNRAAAGFQQLNQNGPGYFYYGVNAADRGLGYVGSYMTLGGFIPYSEDDLGGLWSADLRGHFSVNGGFFSNVGLVRKQFLGGSLLGIGVYWDYDGDQNQYQAFGVCGTEYGQFGHSYNQVGVSGEWLTDFGNLRSNGYMPVGTTAYTAGSPGSPFYRNYVMCQYGLDAALSGADLEVGAYIPGLADWAGMISVGGYALGNARYDWEAGRNVGQDVVPWFGGVYTRLDMTFLENWDFSLQANNDSYFDWTGFARLTYRMGGSRRRNVPDQMEQPMMRNEHIVRAHQTPIMALNAENGNRPWRVIHVDNTAASGGDGSAARPFNELALGDDAATRPWDIVYVAYGDGTANGYQTEFSFNRPNQSLIGAGAPAYIATVCCGYVDIGSTASDELPLLSNPAGASVFIDGDIAGGARVQNFRITGSDVGIKATGDLTGTPTARNPLGASEVRNVAITSDGTSAGQSGVILEDATGGINFYDTQIANMTTVGFEVDGGGPEVNYQGSITNVLPAGGTPVPLINIVDTDGAKIKLAVGSAPTGSTVPNRISDTGGQGIRISGNQPTSEIDIDNVSLTDNLYAAVALLNDQSTTTVTAGSGSGIIKSTPGAAISIEGGGPDFQWQGPIQNSGPAGGPASYLLNVNSVSGGKVSLYGPNMVDEGNGIQILNNTSTSVNVDGARITSQGAQGILIDSNTGGAGDLFRFSNIIIDDATDQGVLITNSTTPVEFSNLTISLAGPNAYGLVAENSGEISSIDNNSIVTASTTNAAVWINNSGPLNMEFATVSSAVPSGSSPVTPAMEFLGTSSGDFKVTSSFSVSGTPGTLAGDVNNPAGVNVTVPPP